MKYQNGFFVMMAILFYPSNVLSHTDDRNSVKTHIRAAAAVTWRSEGVVEPGQSYLIPGALMGGEALPSEKGLSLDEVQIAGTLNRDSYYVSAKLTSHDAESVEMESFWITASEISALGNVMLAAGKMNTEVTPTANWHSSQSTFSEAPLLSDVFFGRHFNDVGVRVSRDFELMYLGVEAFNGDNWPATEGEGNVSAFAQFTIQQPSFDVALNVWGMESSADNRTDTRYTSGHSHGGNVVASPSTELFFSGDVTSFGVDAGAKLTFGGLQLMGQLEWVNSQSNGTLQDSTQSSLYENDYVGYRGLLGLAYTKHQVMFQYEEVALKNNFLSPVTSLFAQNANLENNVFEPSKIIVAWLYNLHPDVILRLEGVQEKTVSPEEVNKVNIGFVWRGAVFE